MLNSEVNEVYHAIVGQVDGLSWWARSLGDDIMGSPGEVDFSSVWERVYDRDLSHRDVIGFFHTHPNMKASPSITDYRTMGAWALCFGRPLLCLIEGVNGLKAHWFIDDEEPHIEGNVSRIGDIFVGNLPDWKTKYTEILNPKVRGDFDFEEDFEESDYGIEDFDFEEVTEDFEEDEQQ